MLTSAGLDEALPVKDSSLTRFDRWTSVDRRERWTSRRLGAKNELDEKAEGTRNSVFVDERFSGVTIQKIKSQYVIRDSNDFSNIILRATTDRKKVEDLLYHMLA